MSHAMDTFTPLNIALLTISDTRTTENDSSGSYLESAIMKADHFVVNRNILPDDIYKIRAAVSQHVADPETQVIILTGGTGISGRDRTPEAVSVLFDQEIEGFGELFRSVSFKEIGCSTIQSRAVAGFANRTLIFSLPGSEGACRTAWNKILKDQLDSRHAPCNFVPFICSQAESNDPIT